MDFDESGDLISYWESSLDRAGKELIGGGIGIESKPLRLSDVQIDVLLLGVEPTSVWDRLSDALQSTRD